MVRLMLAEFGQRVLGLGMIGAPGRAHGEWGRH